MGKIATIVNSATNLLFTVYIITRFIVVVGIYLCRCVDVLNMFPLWRNRNDIIVLICKFMKV